MDKRRRIEEALESMGITNETQLTKAIQSMKSLNLGIMTGKLNKEQERKAS